MINLLNCVNLKMSFRVEYTGFKAELFQWLQYNQFCFKDY